MRGMWEIGKFCVDCVYRLQGGLSMYKGGLELRLVWKVEGVVGGVGY